jgi:hypothetical protein
MQWNERECDLMVMKENRWMLLNYQDGLMGCSAERAFDEVYIRPMKYPDGAEIQPGDRVLMENGKATGTVEAVLGNRADRASWGLDEADEDYVMFNQDGFGLICIDAQGIEWDEVKLISRKTE